MSRNLPGKFLIMEFISVKVVWILAEILNQPQKAVLDLILHKVAVLIVRMTGYNVVLFISEHTTAILG